MWWKREKNGRKSVKLGENPNIPYPECERSVKIPVIKHYNAHSITKYGVLGRLDVQIVALRLVHPLKVTSGARVKKDARRTPGALTLPMRATHVTANVWGRPQMGMARGCEWGRALYQKRHCPFRMYFKWM